jgi:hypothetical protein
MRLPSGEFMGIIDDNGRWVKEKIGMHNTIAMWAHWSENIFERSLGPKIKKDGFKGMAEHWKPILNLEHAGTKIYYDKDQFILQVYDCPHMRFAREHNRPIPDDFDHCLKCFILYYLIVRKYGYNLENIVHNQSGYCFFRITKQSRSSIPEVDKMG